MDRAPSEATMDRLLGCFLQEYGCGLDEVVSGEQPADDVAGEEMAGEGFVLGQGENAIPEDQRVCGAEDVPRPLGSTSAGEQLEQGSDKVELGGIPRVPTPFRGTNIDLYGYTL